MSDLAELLTKIDPSTYRDRLTREVNEAMSRFDGFEPVIIDFWECDEFLYRFFKYLVATCIHRSTDLADESDHRFYAKEYNQIIGRIFPRGGVKAAFEVAKIGVEGGLYGICKKMADEVVDFYAWRITAGYVHEFLKDMSYEEKRAAAKEYAETFGEWLPPEWTATDGLRIEMHLAEVLKEHPHLVGRLRQVVR